MRRIVVAVIMLMSIIITIVVGNYVVKNQCNNFKKEIYTISNLIEGKNDDKAYNAVINSKEKWHRKKAIISIFSNHAPLDEITVSMDELAAATRIKDIEKALIVSARISAHIDRITEEQRIHVESFF